ncbi:peptidase C15, pyroglutamyl peptidase I-like protein [Lizonia empirigonia]|nr:peptidase C15, pyroglutamyl peptidase I-like protein [Lizonia empirigonia]
MASASYVARQPPAEKGEEPVLVLVTGFGPFLDKYPKNSSWEIASTLPALIPASPGNPTPIHIRVHHEPIRVAYNHVLNAIPKLLPRGAHSCGYAKITDVDDDLFHDSAAQDRFPKNKFPEVLSTGFDTSDILARWRTLLGFTNPDGDALIEQLPDVRTNPDAGNFLCGFTYYTSLSHYYEMNGAEGERPVAFMHVPDLTGSETKLREGWEVAVALIKALVESRREVGVRVGSAAASAKQEDDARNNTTN